MSEKNNNKNNKKRRYFNRNRHKKKKENGAEAEIESAEVASEPVHDSDGIVIDDPIGDETPVTVKAPEPIEDGVDIVGVNFRPVAKIYYFDPAGKACKIGEKVIVETARGYELGVVKIPNRQISASEVVPPLRPIVRTATKDDIERARANRALEADARPIFKKMAREHNLDMHLVDAEYAFDNSKLTFYYTSEGRVDFRELVRDLAGVFKTRIELRQIGIRDETKMMGGLGTCGKPYCCAEFLTDFVQVSIKMAKEQNFSLNSAKISGSCGRLMCCLRYEHEAYESALATTPAVGSVVKTASGNGLVVEARPLLQMIKVRLEEKDEIKLFTCEEVKLVRTPKQEKARKNEEKDEQKE